MIDAILFGVFPYVAVAIGLTAGIYRYFVDRFSWSSHSSQFLENRLQFWGSVPWHYAILVILLAHFMAFLYPPGWGLLLGKPTRLFLLEATGLGLGIVSLFGLAVLMIRRAGDSRVGAVTTVMDWLVLAGLLVQVVSGIYIAFTLRWGSYWYLHSAAPWLWSLVRFDPQTQYLAVLPGVVKVHAVNAFLLVALIPFSRLAHLVSVPITYLWRPFQVVIWHRQGRRA